MGTPDRVGGGDSHVEKVGNARQKYSNQIPKETNLGVAPLF